MKKILNSILLLTLAASSTFASNIQQQDLSAKQMAEQKNTIITLAAEEFSKNTPIVIDKYTTFTGVTPTSSSLIWNFNINTGAKSDEAVRKEDHLRMEKAVTLGVCKKSKRFFDADINISYIYNSAKTKEKLFQFDITYDKCIEAFKQNKLYY
jgi:hypothetical protein